MEWGIIIGIPLLIILFGISKEAVLRSYTKSIRPSKEFLEVTNDKQGLQQLRNLIESHTNSGIITTSDGKRYQFIRGKKLIQNLHKKHE